MKVLPINTFEVEPWLLEKHYAKRMPQIMFAFGLYKDDILVGVVTYGIPASPPLCMGICGKEYSDKVLELNRVCLLDNHKNEASFLVANSIKLLPKPMIIVSYADTSKGHVGYVYQATNFLYTGINATRVDWTIRGQEHKHAKTIGDGLNLKKLKEIHGDDFYYVERSRKHRYILFHGSKTDKKVLRSKLKYEVLPYPKGETTRYDSGTTVKTQQLLFV